MISRFKRCKKNVDHGNINLTCNFGTHKDRAKKTGSSLLSSSFVEVVKLEPVKNYSVVTKILTSALSKKERRKAEILPGPGRPCHEG